MKKITKTDGKREISLYTDEYDSYCEVNISICRNGFQSTVVTIDKEMILWLRDAITEYLDKS